MERRRPPGTRARTGCPGKLRIRTYLCAVQPADSGGRPRPRGFPATETGLDAPGDVGRDFLPLLGSDIADDAQGLRRNEAGTVRKRDRLFGGRPKLFCSQSRTVATGWLCAQATRALFCRARGD